MRILILLMGLFISGCSILEPQIGKLASETANAVEDICKEIPAEGREDFIYRVNADLSGQKISLDCGEE